MVLVKIAADPTCNPLLEAEARVLKKLQNAAWNPTAPIRQFLPVLLDSFLVSNEHYQQFRVNVMRYSPEHVSLSDIMQAFTGGLDPRDAAWIARRVVAQAQSAQLAGLVHGAITPDHVLVHPTSHEPLHIGWLHAVEVSGKKTGCIEFVIDRWKDWYPPEVFAKKSPDHRTDIYMAAKTVIWLFGGDTATNDMPHVPDPIRRILLRWSKHPPRAV